jgi:hypothetical protein
MKKLFFFLSLFMFIGVVNAKEITLDEMVDTINNGIITKEVIKLELATMNGDKPKWEEVIINAVRKDNCIDIALIYVGEEGIMGNVNACLLEDGKTLQSIIRYHEDDKYIPTKEIEIHDLLVFWAIEASDSFDEIKEYNKEDDNYLGLMSSYFDKCYREEMHACRTYISNYGNYEYTSDVELNEEAAKYVIKRLKEDKRAEDNKNMLYIIFLVGVGIAVLFVIAKMCEPKAKPIKY